MLQAIIQDEAIKNDFIAKNTVIEAVGKDIFHVLTEGNGNNYFCKPENFPNKFSKFQKDEKLVKTPDLLSICRYFYRVESKSSRHEMTALDIFCGILKANNQPTLRSLQTYFSKVDNSISDINDLLQSFNFGKHLGDT